MNRLTSLILTSLVVFSMAYPFINNYDVFIDYDLDEANEVWDSKEHYEKYLAFRTEDGTIAAVTEMRSEGPTIRIFDITNA